MIGKAHLNLQLSCMQPSNFTSRWPGFAQSEYVFYRGGTVAAVNLAIKLFDHLCLSNQQNGLLPKHPGYSDARNAVMCAGSSLSSRLLQTA